MTDPDPSSAREAYLELVRAHERAAAACAEVLRAQGLTQAQYNVLRILRGAPERKGSCQYVGERLLTREPDVTRLFDRMERAGLVARRRSERDRRVVEVRLTDEGLRLCDALDAPVARLHQAQFASFDPAELEELVARLRRVSATPGAAIPPRPNP